MTFELTGSEGDDYISEVSALLKHEGAVEIFQKEV
jgi:hypothetical protein